MQARCLRSRDETPGPQGLLLPELRPTACTANTQALTGYNGSAGGTPAIPGYKPRLYSTLWKSTCEKQPNAQPPGSDTGGSARSVPRLGTVCTTAWYYLYHGLVLPVPRPGTACGMVNPDTAEAGIRKRGTLQGPPPDGLCRACGYTFVMTPALELSRKETMLRISTLSGTCSFICSMESNRLFCPWNTSR